MTIREQMEVQEETYLSPYAAKSGRTKGRDRPEPECDIRTCYQRDRDRILHCRSFRRLRQKTQVFLLPKGDHYRTRLTHTLEVSQCARTIAKALRLNEDLVEAIALGHDLGHTPFGHAGERALGSVWKFSHNRQGLRVVEYLEKSGRGLNLTWEVRDGILNHQTTGKPSTLEGQVVRLADKIAYIYHDMDDAIRAGILKEEDIPRGFRSILGYTGKERLNRMIHDVIRNSIHAQEIQMSCEIEDAMAELRKFMFEHVYRNPRSRLEEEKASCLVKQLYEHYIRNPMRMPPSFAHTVSEKESEPEQAVCDYIAGMTDNYAIKKYQEIFLPESWPY